MSGMAEIPGPDAVPAPRRRAAKKAVAPESQAAATKPTASRRTAKKSAAAEPDDVAAPAPAFVDRGEAWCVVGGDRDGRTDVRPQRHLDEDLRDARVADVVRRGDERVA